MSGGCIPLYACLHSCRGPVKIIVSILSVQRQLNHWIDLQKMLHYILTKPLDRYAKNATLYFMKHHVVILLRAFDKQCEGAHS